MLCGSAVAAGYRLMDLRRNLNGSSNYALGEPLLLLPSVANATQSVGAGITSGVIQVTPGDYFRLYIEQDSGDLLSYFYYISMQVLE